MRSELNARGIVSPMSFERGEAVSRFEKYTAKIVCEGLRDPFLAIFCNMRDCYHLPQY
jgi:hypothetical protein